MKVHFALGVDISMTGVECSLLCIVANIILRGTNELIFYSRTSNCFD